MVEIGKKSNLRIVKLVDFGAYLDGGEEQGEILIPIKYLPADAKVDDILEVFIYMDSEDRILAVTKMPIAMVGEFAFLEVIAKSQFGAFLNWGLEKDLLCPFREQKREMEEKRSYVVYISLDEKSNRIIASSKIDKYLDLTPHEFKEGQEVDLLVCYHTELGYKAIINSSHYGMIYENEIFQKIKIGDKLKGYIKKVREDLKIDLTLTKAGYEKIDSVSQKILNIIKERGGFVAITDKSEADKIYAIFGESKKTYKKAIGALYKQRLISLEVDGVKIN